MGRICGPRTRLVTAIQATARTRSDAFRSGSQISGRHCLGCAIAADMGNDVPGDVFSITADAADQ